MDYRVEILMLLAYNCYQQSFGHTSVYSEHKAREWAWSQISDMEENEIQGWFDCITSGKFFMEYSYNTHGIRLV